MSYVIEDGIPPPPPAHQGRPKGKRSALLAMVLQMLPGQSVLFVEYKDYNAVRGSWTRLANGVYRTQKCRDGWRLWRIS